MSFLYEAYKTAGNEGFGKLVSNAAPYFTTIDPHFVDVRPGYVEATIENRHEIQNHVGSIHAAALCNTADLVGGILTDVSLPDGRRWIPVAMTVQYLVKAKTDLRAVADGAGIDWSVLGELLVPVDIFDTDGARVMSAQITMNIKDISDSGS